MKDFGLYVFSLLVFTSLFLVGCAHSATIQNGGVTVFDEETNVGKVEICPATFGSKSYASPSWVQHVMTPLNNVSSLAQIPVALWRGPERVLEQSMSEQRDEGNPCFNYRYHVGQNFQTEMAYDNLVFGDSVSVDQIRVSVSITSGSDTE